MKPRFVHSVRFVTILVFAASAFAQSGDAPKKHEPLWKQRLEKKQAASISKDFRAAADTCIASTDQLLATYRAEEELPYREALTAAQAKSKTLGRLADSDAEHRLSDSFTSTIASLELCRRSQDFHLDTARHIYGLEPTLAKQREMFTASEEREAALAKCELSADGVLQSIVKELHPPKK